MTPIEAYELDSVTIYLVIVMTELLNVMPSVVAKIVVLLAALTDLAVIVTTALLLPLGTVTVVGQLINPLSVTLSSTIVSIAAALANAMVNVVLEFCGITVFANLRLLTGTGRIVTVAETGSPVPVRAIIVAVSGCPTAKVLTTTGVDVLPAESFV